MRWATQAGPLKIFFSTGGLAFSFVDPGTEVLICAELSRLSDSETHANHDI